MLSRNTFSQPRNPIGHPCKEYGRFSDKFDVKKFYECGVQPDGAMRIVRRMCPTGEEFSPQYSECVMSSYLKTTNRRRRMMNHCDKEAQCDKGKKKPVSCPEPPEQDNDDENEPANEWVDISKGTGRKVPNEFKPKPKTRLRIYHLHCKRRPVRRCYVHEGDISAELARARSTKHSEKIPRSYVIRVNKKNRNEEELKSDYSDEDEEDDEEEEQEEDEEDHEAKTESEGKKEAAKNSQTGFTRRIQKPGATLSVISPKTDSKSGVSTKVILDADVRLNSAFGEALQKILDSRKLSKKGVAGYDGRNGSLRDRRNFFHGWFWKKKSTKEKEKNAEKEALVNLDHIINGVTSEFEREALLQKLEHKKNKASKIQRSEWRKKKSTFNDSRGRRTFRPHDQSHYRTMT